MADSSQNERKLEMCDGCLSSDRLLVPVGKLRDLFLKIMSYDDKEGIICVSNLWQSEPHLCWECRKVLFNTHRLQQRVYEAQKSLQLAMPAAGCAILSIQCNSLSTLTECIKQSFDYQIIYDENDEILTKEEEDMTVDDGANNEPEVYLNNEENDGSYVGNDEIYLVGDNDDVLDDNDDIVDDYDDVMLISDDEPRHQKSKKAKKKKTRQPKKKISIDRSVYSIVPIGKEEYERQMIRKKQRTLSYKFAEFICDPCAQEFRSKYLLDKHNKDLHDPNNTFDCDVCPVKCHTDMSLKKHKESHVYYKCNICEYRNRSLECFEKHFAIKHSKSFKCRNCGMEFTNKSELGEHARNMHKEYQCDYCGKVCPLKRALASHITQLHMQVKCKICSQICDNREAEKNHYKLKHEKKKSNDPFYCVECKVLFDTGKLYLDHVKYHHGLIYKCKPCSKSFKQKCLLREHNVSHHTRKYKHVCKECDKHFTRNESLTKHILRIHRKIKPDLPKQHVCEYCSRAFGRGRDLMHHVRTHTGARPHACALCTARFAQESPLVTHLRGVHGKAGGFRELLNKYKKASPKKSDDEDSDDEEFTSEDSDD